MYILYSKLMDPLIKLLDNVLVRIHDFVHVP